MKVGVLSYGSRGDIQPLLAIAVGLKRAGHDVVLGAPPNFASLAAKYGIGFRPISFDTRELAERPEIKRIIESGNIFTFLRARILRRKQPILDNANRDAWNAMQDVEALVYKSGEPSAAYSMARKRGIPGIEVMFIPLEPTGQQPAIFPGLGRRRGRLFNRISSTLTYQGFWRMYAPSANRFRRQVLDMPPLAFFGPLAEYARIGQPTLYVYSPSVLPRPNDWRPDVHVVGFTYLDEAEDWEPPADLLRFLNAGDKPVYIGFGSMSSLNSAEKTSVILEGAKRSGQRIVIQQGWGGLGRDAQLPENIFNLAGDIPHSWLFGRMAATMHHAGPGTIAESFRAGVPSICVPHNFDQPFWAQLAYDLGVAPAPIPIKQLSTDRVAGAIHIAVTDTAMRRRAAELAVKIRSEDGVGRAIELFHHYVEKFYARRAIESGEPQPRRADAVGA